MDLAVLLLLLLLLITAIVSFDIIDFVALREIFSVSDSRRGDY